MTADQSLVLAILLSMVALFVSNRMRYDLVALLGLPLSAIVVAVASLLIPLFWPLR